MTYEEWCSHSLKILKSAAKVNKWRVKATSRLLTDIGPRLDKLSRRLYMGCGFHYALQQRFGNLLNQLSLDWQPCANHCDKVESDMTHWMVTKVIYEALVRDVEKAECSAIKLARKKT